eukprot:3376611-Rhodomonas_salina.1
MSILKYAVTFDVPGRTIDSEEFRAMLDKVRRAPSGYIPPNRKRLFCVEEAVMPTDPKRPRPLPNTLHAAKQAVWK